VSLAADTLSMVRLAAAAVLPATMVHGGATPVALVVLAAATDFTDGRVARSAGTPTRHGALLDNVADVAFVLGGTATAVVLGLLPWAVPAAIALSVGAYAIASARLSADTGAPCLARSRSGHVAGVVNYLVVALVAAAIALPGPAWKLLLAVAAAAGVAANLAAVAERAMRAPAPRAGESTVQ
jgi:phosphatidylglycerophosphate synthase